MPRLAAALERDGDAAVRATALAALADLATVRTALVDAKAGAPAGALLDPADAVAASGGRRAQRWQRGAAAAAT